MTDSILQLIIQYKYPLIIVLTCVEGPLIMMISGFLLNLGYLSFVPVFISLVIGDLAGDIGWYTVGYHLGTPFVRKFGKYFGITEDNIAIIKRIFHRRENTILIVSKITMGFGFAVVTLVTAGLVKIPFRRYLALNFAGQFIWTGLLMYIGFAFGNVYVQINTVLGRISVIAFFIIAFLTLIAFGKYIRARTIRSNSL